MSAIIKSLYSALIAIGTFLQPLVLLALRGYWGWEFYVTGRDKLLNITPVIEFFTSLGIPLPTFNAYIAGGIECAGGICLLLGFASRLISVPLIVVMITAYYTAHHAALVNVFADPKTFIGEPPFNFLLVAVIVFAFGPGLLSIDALLKRVFHQSKV